MKKKLVAVAAVIAMLMYFSLNGFAAQTKELPANLNGVVAYSYEDATSIAFTNEGVSGTFYSGNDANTENMTDISLVDVDGGKAAKIDFLEEVNGLWLHNETFRTGNWPAAGEPVKGWFFRVSCTGGEAWLTQFRMRFGAKIGTFDGNTEIVNLEIVPGFGTENTVRIFDLEGNELWELVDPRNGYDALVMLDDGFDGYIVVDFSETLYADAEHMNIDPSILEWIDIANSGLSHMSLEWVEEGTSLTFSDYGYLTASPTGGEEPTDEPTDEPTEEPTEEPSAEPTAEVSPSPVVSPSPAVSPSPVTSPSASPAASDEADTNIWLYVGIGAAVLIVAAVVVFFVIKKGKKKEA